MDSRNQFILDNLKQLINTPKSELVFSNSFELLVAVLLSAQCTDKRVNMITPSLFKAYPDPYALSKAKLIDVENIIKSCGFYHNKAKNIIELSKKLVNNFNGVVPNNRESLMTLDGVGRKTANVVLAVAFNEPAIAVDTHVHRVSNRLGLSSSNDVEVIEQDLMNQFDKDCWVDLHHYLLLFGRYYCKSQNPSCSDCVLKSVCKYVKE